MPLASRYDVVILGAGLAGLSLARHLLLETRRSVLLLDRRSQLPPSRQKVGESTVQVAGHYFARILDLEEHLLHEHFMKYNLRFYWPAAQRDGTGFEDYSKAYIRSFSNVASYQIDRNVFEAELLRRNAAAERCTVVTGIRGLDVQLSDDAEPHRVTFEANGEPQRAEAGWVVDTTGRNRILAGRQELDPRPDTVRHSAFFCWVEGLVDIERLTELSLRERRQHPERRFTGHLPSWLATNHFLGEGFWFWVIPLRGKTSLGLVFDPRRVPTEEVFSKAKLIDWVCRRFPLFERDLRRRKILSGGGIKSFGLDAARTLSPQRWALAGEAGRFSDPLYSPGSDLIAIYNTLIVDAIETEDPQELRSKCQLHESLMRATYSAYLPTYNVSYDVLGDVETFSLKYTWELAVYFSFFVFPFLNELLPERRFALAYLRQLSRLGPINEGMQHLLQGFYEWKKEHLEPQPEPVFHDFTELAPLARAATTFYRVGVSVEEGREVLASQMANQEELGRFITAWIAATVLDEPAALTHRGFIEDIDVTSLAFDPQAFAERWARCTPEAQPYRWSFDGSVMEHFHRQRRSAAATAPRLMTAEAS